MYGDTLNFVASYTKCLQTKRLSTPPAPLQPTYTPRFHRRSLSTDSVVPFKNSQSILTITGDIHNIRSRPTLVFPLNDTRNLTILNV